MMDYELVTISAREPWTTVARGGDYVLLIEYHDGEWTSPAPEAPDSATRVRPNGYDEEGRWTVAPMGLPPGTFSVPLSRRPGWPR